MSIKIVIIGSTGKLGDKLLNFLGTHSIKILCSTCYKNKKKLLLQRDKYKIKNCFSLKNKIDQNKFVKFLEQKIDIIYFLDYGSLSLKYLNHFLKFNNNSVIAIANKEMIIAGGSLLHSKLKKTNSLFIPLDSEHFSLTNSKINKNNIQKIFITASGGHFI